MRLTKIIATLGPASWTEEGIANLAAAGTDVFRVNCSHSSSLEVAALCSLVRQTAPECAVLVDIQGPKLRLGEVSGSVAEGDSVLLAHAQMASPGEIPLSFDPERVGVRTGDRLLINDGRVELLVERVGPSRLSARVLVGGNLSSRKGVNLPDTAVLVSMLSAKDKADVEAGLSSGADWFAQSFVQTAADVLELRKIVGDGANILAKIERPQALDWLDDICAVADGVMAARGDLGVELPFELVPETQRLIAAAALRAGVVGVCATEMLESMVSSQRPTRAEVNDVATAVRDGFDAVMLSAETAVGVSPTLAVETMARVCKATEDHERIRSPFANAHPLEAAVSASTASLAARLDAPTIVSLTSTGYTARLLASCRPPSPITAVTSQPAVARQLRLNWGVAPVVVPRADDMHESAEAAVLAAAAAGMCEPGDTVVLCASRGTPKADVDTIWVVKVP